MSRQSATDIARAIGYNEQEIADAWAAVDRPRREIMAKVIDGNLIDRRVHSPQTVYRALAGTDRRWMPCTVAGCTRMENKRAGTGKCHPHSYPGPLHALMRFIRGVFL